MIDKISSASHVYSTKINNQTQKGDQAIDVRNMSPNEMGAWASRLFENGEISGQAAIALIPLDTRPLSLTLEKEVHLKYSSRVWDNPNQKRNMLAQFKTILQERIHDNDDPKNIAVTKAAISVLEHAARQTSQPSFRATLEAQVNNQPF